MKVRNIIGLVLLIALFSSCDRELKQGVVRDHQGNCYRTVRIGTQTWMAENMRCTVTPSGRILVNGAQDNEKPYYIFLGDSVPEGNALYPCNEYLYNCAAALDENSVNECHINSFVGTIRGICPKGWHIPTLAEWDTLFDYVSQHYPSLKDSTDNAKALASTKGWNVSYIMQTPGNWPQLNNKTGFNALPTGRHTEDKYTCVNSCAHFMTANEYNANSWWSCWMYSNRDTLEHETLTKRGAISVRCIKDEK